MSFKAFIFEPKVCSTNNSAFRMKIFFLMYADTVLVGQKTDFLKYAMNRFN